MKFRQQSTQQSKLRQKRGSVSTRLNQTAVWTHREMEYYGIFCNLQCIAKYGTWRMALSILSNNFVLLSRHSKDCRKWCVPLCGEVFAALRQMPEYNTNTCSIKSHHFASSDRELHVALRACYCRHTKHRLFCLEQSPSRSLMCAAPPTL